jgi:Fe-S cluster assembly protein SufD
MENLLQKEIYQNAKKITEADSVFSPSYSEQRKNALHFFNTQGIPTKKNEDWIYTNIGKTLSPRFTKSLIERNFSKDQVIDPTNVIVLNNGFINRTHSKISDGISYTSPKNTNSFHDVFDALNMATADDPTTIQINKNTKPNTILTILHLTDENNLNKISSPRIHFQIEANSEITIIEIFTSEQRDLYQYTTNAHTSFVLNNNAHVTHVKLNLEAKNSTHIGLTKADLSRDSVFNSFVVDLGTLVSRNNVEIHLNEENANACVHGLFNLKNNEHSDNFTSIYHHSKHTQSEQLYKGILDNDSHGAFTGKIVIDHGAYGVNSSQLNKNLLLSKKAHIDTRPQLLVSADDVKCAHGATVGELSAEEEFYLTSRGIPKQKARNMLATGFAHEVLLKMNNKSLFNFINKYLAFSGFNS